MCNQSNNDLPFGNIFCSKEMLFLNAVPFYAPPQLPVFGKMKYLSFVGILAFFSQCGTANSAVMSISVFLCFFCPFFSVTPVVLR